MLPVFRDVDVSKQRSGFINQVQAPARHNRDLEGINKQQDKQDQSAGERRPPTL